MLRVHNPIAAYWFDECAGWFGHWVETMMSQKDPKTGRPLYALWQLLGIDPTV
jgi:hypothetical protein